MLRPETAHERAPFGRVEAVLGFLRGAGVSFELIEHEPGASTAATAQARGVKRERVAKAVVLNDGGEYVVAAVPAGCRVDIGRLRKLLGATAHLRLASDSEIARQFPMLELGAMPPFGPMLPAAAVIDRGLAAQREVLCPAGDAGHSVLLDPREIVRITSARIAEVCAG